MPVDVARLRLIRELHHDLAIDAEAMPVVLSLVDEMYTLRRRLAALARALAETPAEVRTTVVTAVGSCCRKNGAVPTKHRATPRRNRWVERLPAIGSRAYLSSARLYGISSRQGQLTYIGGGLNRFTVLTATLDYMREAERSERTVAAMQQCLTSFPAVSKT